VLSFPSESPSGELGDIAISVDRAREQANAYGHDLSTEVRILLLHGVLHLLGHDHEIDRGKMRRLETRWRKEFGLPTGLIERAGKPAAPQGRSK
jgi:probable rRNA maturation factor